MSTGFRSSCPNLSLPLPTTLSRHCYHHDLRSIPRWEKERFRDPTSSDRLSLRLPSSAYSIRPRFDWCPSTPSDGVPGFTGFFVQCGLLDRKIYCGRRKNKKGKATTRRTGKKRAEWGGLRLLKGTFEKICGCFLLSSSNLPLFMRSHDDNAESRILQILQPSLPVSLRRIKLKNILLLMLLVVCGNGAFLVSRDYITLKQLLVFANSFWRRRRSRRLRNKAHLVPSVRSLVEQLKSASQAIDVQTIPIFGWFLMSGEPNTKHLVGWSFIHGAFTHSLPALFSSNTNRDIWCFPIFRSMLGVSTLLIAVGKTLAAVGQTYCWAAVVLIGEGTWGSIANWVRAVN